MKQHAQRMLAAFVAVAGLIVALACGPAHTYAAGPHLAVSPANAPAGSIVTINGSGFRPGEIVTLYWRNSPPLTAFVSSGGTFARTLTIPSDATAGLGVVVARGSGGDSASAILTVTGSSTPPPPGPTATPPPGPTAAPPPAASPTSGVTTAAPSLMLTPDAALPGSAVTIDGSGFAPGEMVTLRWNGATIALLAVSSRGTFALAVMLSALDPAGPRTITADGSRGDHAQAVFTVLASSGSGVPNPTPTPPPPSLTPTPPSSPTPAPPAPTSTPAGTSGSGCATTPEDAQAEQYLLSRLNADRAAAGVRALTLNATLSQASRAHSCDMLQHQTLSHMGSDGSNPFQRIQATGVPFSTAGENIGMAGGYGLTGGIDVIDRGMMSEPLTQGTHHWNIVNAAYSQVGLGVFYANGQVWLTEDFIG